MGAGNAGDKTMGRRVIITPPGFTALQHFRTRPILVGQHTAGRINHHPIGRWKHGQVFPRFQAVIGDRPLGIKSGDVRCTIVQPGNIGSHFRQRQVGAGIRVKGVIVFGNGRRVPLGDCAFKGAVGFLDLGLALVFQQAWHVRLPDQRVADGKRLGKDIRIINSGLVANRILIHEGITLRDYCSSTVKIAGSIHPGAVVEIAHFDDKGIAFPVTSGVAHEVFKAGVGRLLSGTVNKPVNLCPFKQDGHMFLGLEYLEGPGHGHDAGNTGQVALVERIQRGTVGEIFLLLFACPVLVGDGATLDDAETGLHVMAGNMGFKIEGCAGLGFPDTLQERCTAFSSWNVLGLHGGSQ